MRSQLARGTITTWRMSTLIGSGRSCISKGIRMAWVAKGHASPCGAFTIASTAGQPSVRIAMSAALLFVAKTQQPFQLSRAQRQATNDVLDADINVVFWVILQSTETFPGAGVECAAGDQLLERRYLHRTVRIDTDNVLVHPRRKQVEGCSRCELLLCMLVVVFGGIALLVDLPMTFISDKTECGFERGGQIRAHLTPPARRRR